jgi:hypothetical protein
MWGGICRKPDGRYSVDVLAWPEAEKYKLAVGSLCVRSSDLALARITAKWRHSLRIFQDFQRDCAKLGFDLDLSIHLKNLTAFSTGQSRFLRLDA